MREPAKAASNQFESSALEEIFRQMKGYPYFLKGMIYSPARGEMSFTVPLFDEFMIRAIPRFKG